MTASETTDVSANGGAETSRRALVFGVVAAVVAALFLYARTYVGAGHGFVNYDDPYLLAAENPAIGRGLWGSIPEFARQLTDSPRFMNAWLPLYYWSLGLDHALFGDAAWGYHLHSAILHAIGAGLVVLIAARLGTGALGAAIAGLLFAVHPAATENVAWVAGRKDVLAFAWMAGATLAYLEGVRRGRWGWHVLGAALLLVSLTAKGTTLVLPFLLCLHALLLRTPRSRSNLVPVIPYAVVAAGMTLVHLLIARAEGTAGGAGSSGPGVARILFADLEVAWRYVVVLVAPFVGQSVEHGIDGHTVSGGAAALGAVTLVALIAGVALTWKKRPAVAAFLLAFPLALAPFNNLLPRTSVLFAERYAHIALLPFVIGAGALAAGDSARRIALFVATAGFAITSFQRIPVWENAISLWNDATEKNPASAFARLQLADALAAEARARPAEAVALFDESERAWREARRLAKDDLSKMRAAAGLGTHLLTVAPAGGSQNTEERVRESVVLFDEAYALLGGIVAPGAKTTQVATILSNRAAARELLGDLLGAVEDLKIAAQADSRNVSVLNSLARTYFLSGRGPEASEALALSAKLAPEDPAAARERARIRLAGADHGGAKAEIARALTAHPDDYDLLMDAGRIDQGLLRPLDAAELYRRAIAVRPGDEAATNALGATLLDQAQSFAATDELEKAREAAAAALTTLPSSFAPHQVLGIIARRAGDLEGATTHLRKAYELFPAGVRIREALASVLVERAWRALDAGNDAAAVAFADEAVAVNPGAIATPKARIESGASGWPAQDPAADAQSLVARHSALRALACLAWGRADKALPEIEVAAAGTSVTDPAMRRVVLRLLVRTRFLSGLADTAVAAAEELPALGRVDDAQPWSGFTDLVSALVERGIVRRGAGDKPGAKADFDRAWSLLDEARAAGLPESKFHTRRGEIRFAAEEFVEATVEFDKAIAIDPRDVEPLLDRAAVWRSHFLMEEEPSYLRGAEQDIRRALEVAPADARVMAALGEILVMSQKQAEAYPFLQRALLSDASQHSVRRMLAELTARAGRQYLEKGEHAKALSAAERAVALDADTPTARILLGDVHLSQQAYEKAYVQYEAANKAFPDSEEARAALAKFYAGAGHLYLVRGARADAARAFRRALSFEQTKFDVSSCRERLHVIAGAAFNEAATAMKAGEYAKAADGFRLSVYAEPTKEGHFQLGVCLDETKDPLGAEKAYAAALAIDPKFLPAAANRGASLLVLGRWEEAEAMFVTVRDLAEPGSPDRRFAERKLAWIEEQRRTLEDGPEEKR